jgi:plasmid stability protein
MKRKVDEGRFRNVRERAAAHGQGAEADHRENLAEMLHAPQRGTFAEALMSIPTVGRDIDFSRTDD